MDQINAVIDCDVARLDFPLRPWKARVAHNFVALFRRVPADVTGLFVRLFKADGSYFDVTAHEHADGIWLARIGAACFPAELDGKYEVHAYAADDQPAAIGEGRLVVQPFSATAAVGTVPDGETQQVATLPTADGGTVQVVMVYADGEWRMQAVV
ncbi:MAG: hypothetical protein IJI54_05985 [Kiritimatiellae bacterium]|nr:hypothetical protein [Kiritimatiellia bacterium]